jgi:excisionase family DNA binding protein
VHTDVTRIAYSIKEVASQIGVSAGLVRLEIARGVLRPTQIGRRLVVAHEELQRYLRENTISYLRSDTRTGNTGAEADGPRFAHSASKSR